MRGKGKDAALRTLFRASWGEETFEIPYGEMHRPRWEPNLVSKQPTPSEEPKEHGCLKPGPSRRALAAEPTCMDQGLPQRMAAPKLAFDEIMDLLSRVIGAGDEEPDLSALSAALKTKLGLFDLKKPPPNPSPGVERLTRDMKSCRGIRSSPMDTCPSPFHPRVGTVPVCTVGDTTKAEMRSYGLAALVPLATAHPSAPSGGRRTKAIATANPADWTPRV